MKVLQGVELFYLFIQSSTIDAVYKHQKSHLVVLLITCVSVCLVEPDAGLKCVSVLNSDSTLMK